MRYEQMTPLISTLKTLDSTIGNCEKMDSAKSRDNKEEICKTKEI